MVVADITVWLIIVIFFNYFIIYKRNPFFGSLGYLLFGILMFGTKAEFGYTQAIYGYIAMFIMLGGLMGLIYEALNIAQRGRHKR